MRLIDADDLIAHTFKNDISYKAFVNLVKKQQTIEERKTGEWHRRIDTRFGPKLNDIIICSECSIAFSTEDMFRRAYCPNCGARMIATKGGPDYETN